MSRRREAEWPASTPAPAIRNAPGLDRVRLLKDHAHRRVEYKAGVELAVSPDVAAWLQEQGVAEPAKPVAPSSED